MRSFYVYILASQKGGTLYIGVTNDIARRLAEHRAGDGGAFTRRYRVFRLVHVEEFPTAIEAIAREKSLKKWPRRWKIELIERGKPYVERSGSLAAVVGRVQWRGSPGQARR
jgi:putative endonuclease